MVPRGDHVERILVWLGVKIGGWEKARGFKIVLFHAIKEGEVWLHRAGNLPTSSTSSTSFDGGGRYKQVAPTRASILFNRERRHRQGSMVLKTNLGGGTGLVFPQLGWELWMWP